jgi:AraC-like DNA-binding protein
MMGTVMSARSAPSSDRAVSLPAPVLRPFISHYAGFYADGVAPGTHAGLPSRHMHLIIGLGEGREGLIDVVQMPSAKQRARAFRALVSGLQEAPATVRHNGILHGLHVFLRPLAVRAILGVPGVELASCVFDLSDLWGRAADGLIDRLKCARGWQQRFDILNEEFVRRLAPIAARREIACAWGWLAQARGSLSVESLARELRWSRRHFTERFRAEAGITPRTAARIFRFERACRLIKDERPRLAEAACECGYHDQAHMTREWNALAGCTPKSWIARELPIVQDYELAGGYDRRSRSAP